MEKKTPIETHIIIKKGQTKNARTFMLNGAQIYTIVKPSVEMKSESTTVISVAGARGILIPRKTRPNRKPQKQYAPSNKS